MQALFYGDPQPAPDLSQLFLLINGPSIFFIERSSTSSITDDSSFSSNFAT